MKKLLFVLCLFTCALFSCSDETEPLKQSEEDLFIPVSFSFSGQELELSEMPLTRSGDNEAKDWYAFQVYSRTAGTVNAYQPYAYGFFDNTADMKINLKDGYEYKFDVWMAVDASEKVCYFSLTGAGWTPVQNTFKISATEYVRYMYEGYLYMLYPDSETRQRPMVDRFMGQTEGYVPQDGGVVAIEMKRVAFGVQFVPANFTSGKLEIDIEGAGMLEMTAGVDSVKLEMISFNNIGEAYLAGAEGLEYAEDVPVNIVWVNADGVRTPIANQHVSFKRNMLTQVEFEVKENASSNGISINGDERLEIGDSVVIGGDGNATSVVTGGEETK